MGKSALRHARQDQHHWDDRQRHRRKRDLARRPGGAERNAPVVEHRAKRLGQILALIDVVVEMMRTWRSDGDVK